MVSRIHGNEKDRLFFGLLGIVLGIVQKYGYDNIVGKNCGSDLLQEHIAFESLLILTGVVWFPLRPGVACGRRLSPLAKHCPFKFQAPGPGRPF